MGTLQIVIYECRPVQRFSVSSTSPSEIRTSPRISGWRSPEPLLGLREREGLVEKYLQGQSSRLMDRFLPNDGVYDVGSAAEGKTCDADSPTKPSAGMGRESISRMARN